MNTPHLYYVGELLKRAPECMTQHPEAGWIPARGLGWQGLSLRRRLSIAWGVFTGKYDAVYWEPRLGDIYKREDNSDLRDLLGKATDAARGVNVFTTPAMASKMNALTTATPARTFKEPPGEEQTADDAAVLAAIAAGTQMLNQ